MIAAGPVGALPPVRPVGEGPLQANQPAAPAAAVSGARGEARAATRVETANAVEAPRQSGGTDALRRDERADEARARRDFVEPSRAAAEMLAAETPDEATPAGPPPTFAWSILEKARAVGATPPPVGPASPEAPPPEPAPETVKAVREAEARSVLPDAAAPSGRQPGVGARERAEPADTPAASRREGAEERRETRAEVKRAEALERAVEAAAAIAPAGPVDQGTPPAREVPGETA